MAYDAAAFADRWTGMTPKEQYLAAVRGEKHDRVPVTPIFMAWAAHHIGHTYRDFQLDGDVLADAQLAVTRAFGVGQVSAISDPWREASGYGMEFDYPAEGVGVPKGKIITSADDVAELRPLEPSGVKRMAQRVASVARMAAEVGSTHSVLGWIEGPIAEYADLRGMEEAMIDLIQAPEMFARAAEVLVQTGLNFATAQIEAGADTIGVGDATASLVGPRLYAEHVLPWERKLFEGIHEAGGLVKLHICGDIRDIVADMARSGADIIDADWMVPLAEARRAAGPHVALAGNFDPVEVLLRGTPQQVAEAAAANIADAGGRFILQPGCEVPQHTPEQNIRAFCPCEGCLIADALNLQ